MNPGTEKLRGYAILCILFVGFILVSFKLAQCNSNTTAEETDTERMRQKFDQVERPNALRTPIETLEESVTDIPQEPSTPFSPKKPTPTDSTANTGGAGIGTFSETPDLNTLLGIPPEQEPAPPPE